MAVKLRPLTYLSLIIISGVDAASPSSPSFRGLNTASWRDVAFVATSLPRRRAFRRGFDVSPLGVSNANEPKILTPDEADECITPLLNLASAHFASQALLAIVRLGVPDVIGTGTLTVDDVIADLGSGNSGGAVNCDALLRSMRMLSSAGIFEESFTEEGEFAYSLTPSGALLQSKRDGLPDHQPSLGCCVEHWTEKPLWDAWAALPDYVAGASDELPFEQATGAPAAEFYGQNPSSLRHQNDFVRFVSSREEPAVLNGFDWSSLKGSTLVDVGGYYGAVMGAVARSFPGIRCISMDLPEVVEMAPEPPPGVELVGGDMFDPSTIPKCDTILLRHMLCNFDDKTATQILQNCHSVLPDNGKVIIGDIVLPDAGEATTSGNGRTKIFVDSLMMLVGVRGERIKSQWAALASTAGFRVNSVVSTSSPSCDMMVLTKV